MNKNFFGKDKLYHFIVCLMASFFSTELAIGLGIGKEVGDHFNQSNKWDWYDILADGIGTAIGTLIRVIIIHRYNWF